MRIDPKSFLNFSKKDRVGALVLLSITALLIASFFLYHPAHPPVTITTLNEELAKQGTDTTTADESLAFAPSDETEVTTSNAGELFQFDPNTLDAAGFKRLHLQDKTINTIINYRNKGGRFYKPDDLRKIYSLRKEDADRLIPYVQLQNTQSHFTQTKQTGYTKSKPAIIDINTATADDWKTLPAIGEVLAGRIVKYREKIGGFTSVAQVKQTYGITDSAFAAIKPYLKTTAATQTTVAIAPQQEKAPEKVNINTASVNQLKSNPHIPETVAQAIVIYRTQHGNFASVEDIKKIVFINEETFRQVAPYLRVE